MTKTAFLWPDRRSLAKNVEMQIRSQWERSCQYVLMVRGLEGGRVDLLWCHWWWHKPGLRWCPGHSQICSSSTHSRSGRPVLSRGNQEHTQWALVKSSPPFIITETAFYDLMHSSRLGGFFWRNMLIMIIQLPIEWNHLTSWDEARVHRWFLSYDLNY